MASRFTFIFFVLVLLSFNSIGQSRFINKNEIFNKQRLGITAGIGLSSYYGDLCDNFDCAQFRPNIGIGAMLRMTRKSGLKADLNYFRLYSDDVHPQRNLDFRSNNVELYVAGYIQYHEYARFERQKKKLNPYAFAGIGLMYFSPQGSLNGEWHNLRPLQTEGINYSPVTPVIPFGAGLIIHLNKQYEIIIEAGYRKTFSDYIDDASSYFWIPIEEFEDPIAAAISNKTGQGNDYISTYQYRGNPNRKDGYFIGQIKINYIIQSSRTNYKLRRAPLRKRF